MERIARDRYEGKTKLGELDDAHILRTYDELSKAAGKGYGSRFTTVLNDKGEPSPEVLKMRQNLYKFSMVKDYAMLEELNGYLSGGKDTMRWEEFRTKALELNKKYNLNYLQAEWQTALQAGKFASLWEDYQANKDLFPSLRYRTQGDDQVRPEHEKLEGIVKPLEDPFWSSYYPPNGWRCRCYVVQTAERPTPEKDMPKIGPEDVKPEFKTNVGNGGEVFKETSENKGKPHPYFALAKTAESDTKKAFELAKLAAKPHTIYKGKNGGKVQINVFTDKRSDELLGNYRAAKVMVDQYGLDVTLRAMMDGDIVQGQKQPEYTINNALAERKSPEGAATKNTLKKANKQKAEYVVFDLWRSKASADEILEDLKGRLRFENNYPSIKHIIIIDKNRKARKYQRSYFKNKKAE